ncbi:maleylacetoacetate isomerase [Rhodobacteraceae bacterium N5(2021)]|uniref:Maleylacetoacetate isomerase n=1 Tax=Gymnodinialimonas phycosphaerae TaxID=2841589 RepID=A0A975TVT3_9RHOB|nr:maleylacetoacetate isomerase [Gymnodinialimonas phycosphaerae]MBY4891299.1 maleylacetoacetate isomerase [Gymnodinialimonas phycosphaerae]
MILYSYWRSTTSYRVRAALNLKRVAYSQRTVDLVTGDQRAPDYAALNPGKGVPTLQLDDGTILTQSLAIIDFLDATYPDPPMLSGDPAARARQLAVALTVATDIHPVNNLRVVGQLKSRFNATADDAQDWMCHWMAEGFAAIEDLLPDTTHEPASGATQTFAFGDTPDLADLCITAQVYNAHRWGVDLTPYPKIARIEAACLAIPEIQAAAPENQPDAPR